MKKVFLLALVVSATLTDCTNSKNDLRNDLVNSSINPISVSGTRFTDSYGRQVIFSGVNKVNKDPGMNYIDKDSAGSYRKLSQWGFNCIRLGLSWDGIEHEPGKYDEQYLDKLEEHVKWASQNGMYVLLDMHQDLYGVSFGEGTTMGDGAPEWATLTENQPHLTGEIWSDSYLISPAVQKAFDNFWANKQAPDGIGLQDHYARMWQTVAKRFAGYKCVLGYDIMNEPFNGTQANNILPALIKGYAVMLAEETGKILSEKDLMATFSSEESKLAALSSLDSKEKYSRFVNNGEALNQDFERTSLQPMYQRVGKVIREVDSIHILFLEHAYFGNTGMRSGIERLTDKNGEPDPLVAYAPHGYDILVDTKDYRNTNNCRIDVIFNSFRETSERLNMPVLVGEWGAFPGNSESATAAARFITGLIEKFSFGNTYWSYYIGLPKEPYFTNAIVRPYPQYIAGVLKNTSFNHDSGLFSCSWDEKDKIKAPTVIFIPDLSKLEQSAIVLKPAGKTEIVTISDSKAGYIVIPPAGTGSNRTIEFKITI